MTGPMQRITGAAAAMLENGIDTDVIFPARFLLRMDKQGLGECLFADRRVQGREGAFALDRRDGRPVRILLAGGQFGCGSSREHAVWSLVDFGIRVVIAPSFGEIFASNAARNGLAAIPLGREQVEALAGAISAGDLAIDLADSTITTAGGAVFRFDMAEADRHALINGWDEIDMLDAGYHDRIDGFEAAYRGRRPWLFRTPADG
ncbi:MAG: 3-isopropylmalate dehydratase small subunit [Sandarakinorhabdus sp.]|nr:3-isopropylmalate dehydratase small subunit [Sandarakinorhabdus sp.]